MNRIELKELKRKNLLSANTSGQIVIRATPDEIGMELIRLMSDEITNWGGKYIRYKRREGAWPKRKTKIKIQKK